MKRIIILLAFLFLSLSGLYAQCNPFYMMADGATREMTSYNSKDKVEGRQTTKVVDMVETGNGWDATLAVEIFDKKGKKEYDNQMEMSCENGVIKMDMTRFMPAEMMESADGMEMKISGDNLQWPEHLETGMTLPDASMQIDMGIMKFTTSLVDRKVEGRETVTTSAGTFDCYKITYTIKSKSIMNIEMGAADYITEKIGVIKTESYDKKGNLKGYTLLTQYGGF